MRVLPIITHPTTLIISFLLILISGEHLGGFYALYLLLALPDGGLHSLLAIAGILILVLVKYKSSKVQYYRGFSILNMAALILLIASLFQFFSQNGGEYNYGTFYQVVPVISLMIFGILALSFLVKNILQLVRPKLSID